MGRTRAVLVLLAVLLPACKGCPGCKAGKPAYNRSTPVDTINSFRRALEAGRIPEDTLDFFLNPGEEISWKLRCEGRGCNRANFKIDKVVSEDEYAATYTVTFDVFGDGNLRVMSGREVPITFAYQNGAWYFDQIGTITEVKLKGPGDRRPEVLPPASPPDGGGTSDAAPS